MTDNGFILLSRSILESDVFASQKLLKIWIWCLCRANYKDRSIPFKIGKGETIINVKRGSFVFGRLKAEEQLFIDGSTIYKLMQKLQDLEMITIKSNNQYSIISICNYDTYQNLENYKVTSKEQVSSKQVTSKEQASNTDKKDKNDNKLFYESEIEKSRQNGNDKKIIADYEKFVKFIFGNNSAQIPLTTPLKMKSQLSYDQFCKLMDKTNFEAICQKLYALQNNPKYEGKYSNLYMTLVNWTKNDK